MTTRRAERLSGCGAGGCFCGGGWVSTSLVQMGRPIPSCVAVEQCAGERSRAAKPCIDQPRHSPKPMKVHEIFGTQRKDGRVVCGGDPTPKSLRACFDSTQIEGATYTRAIAEVVWSVSPSDRRRGETGGGVGGGGDDVLRSTSLLACLTCEASFFLCVQTFCLGPSTKQRIGGGFLIRSTRPFD